jgi:putative membrane protein
MTEAVLAASHFIAILLMVTFLAIETALLRPLWMPAALVSLPRYDRLYRGMLALVLITGLLRLALGAKGAAFDLGNPLFHVKLTGFAVMVLLTFPVTRQLHRWQTARLADPAFVPDSGAVRRLRRVPMLAVHLLVILPVLAALVARGHGLR